jgi:hypothetical protein
MKARRTNDPPLSTRIIEPEKMLLDVGNRGYENNLDENAFFRKTNSYTFPLGSCVPNRLRAKTCATYDDALIDTVESALSWKGLICMEAHRNSFQFHNLERIQVSTYRA